MRIVWTNLSGGLLAEVVFSSEKQMFETFHRLSFYYEGRRSFIGFNIDYKTFEQFCNQFTLTKCERELQKKLQQNPNKTILPTYIIAYGHGDRETREHEFKHAKFHINKNYHENVLRTWNSLTVKQKDVITTHLNRLGYRKDKWVDEAQAYGLISVGDL